MSFFNKLYKYVFRKKVQKEYDVLFAEKIKIEAEIAKLKDDISDKLQELESMHKQGLISDSDYAVRKKAILSLT